MSQSLTSERDEGYEALEQVMRRRVPSTLLVTNAADVWQQYLYNLREDRRKHYDCHACKKFIQAVGHLISEDGTPLMPTADEVPEFFRASFAMIEHVVRDAKIIGVHVSKDPLWGERGNVDKKGRVWSHLHLPNPNVYTSALLTAGQRMAELKEDHAVLCRSLSEYPRQLALDALRVLKSNTIRRAEKALALVEWFVSVHSMSATQKWAAVAHAPPGFCHVKNTVGATLMDDVRAGKDFAEIEAAWNSKMDPLKYQRPTAAPSEGQIDAAEAIVAKLGIARSFERRFAELSEVQVKLWQPSALPKVDSSTSSGVFSHLRKSAEQRTPVELPAVNMTWEKFRKTVLPNAHELEILCPHNGDYYALVAAVNADAPPIFQWDSVVHRNSVNWYVYPGGSSPARWNLSAGWKPVTAVFLGPQSWASEDGFGHQGKQVHFAIEGAYDTNATGSGLALFPEIMRSELHGIRSVVERHSRGGTVAGRGSANGLMFRQGPGVKHVTLRIDGKDSYTLDRWD